MKQLFSITLVFLFSLMTFAETDQAVDNSLKDTKDLLKDKTQREAVFKKDAKAKAADDTVQNLTGGDAAQTQQVYDISADAFAAIMQSVGNDPNKAMELLQKAQGNPEAFYNSLPNDVRIKIRGVASEIEKKGAAKSKP